MAQLSSEAASTTLSGAFFVSLLVEGFSIYVAMNETNQAKAQLSSLMNSDHPQFVASTISGLT